MEFKFNMSNKNNKAKYTSLGKFLSLVLRHKPEVINITLDEYGWANVEELINGINATSNYSITTEILEQIVANNNKNRYSFNKDKTLIRANQGHSVSVDVELEECEPPDVLYHGTAHKFTCSIEEVGIIPKSRLYVHLSTDIDTATKVGERHGSPIIYSVEAKRMYYDGYKFYKSVNGIWLTKFIPVEYFIDRIQIYKFK